MQNWLSATTLTYQLPEQINGKEGAADEQQTHDKEGIATANTSAHRRSAKSDALVARELSI